MSDEYAVTLTADASISAARSRNRRRSIARGDAVLAEATRVAAEARAETTADAGLTVAPPAGVGGNRRHGRRRSVVQEQMDQLYDEMRAGDAKNELFPFVR
jgi:hypothetical protein